MLDLRLFRDRRFSVASGGIALTYFAMFGTFFLSAQFLQLVLGLSALEAGLLQLPMSAVMLLVAPRVPSVSARYGVAASCPSASLSSPSGCVVLSQLDASSHPLTVWLAIIPMAFGVAATGAPLTTVLMSAVPAGRAGVGSAMNDTSRELGGALGVAVLGSVLTTRYGSALAPAVADLPEQARTVATSGLAGALGVAGDLGAGGRGAGRRRPQAFLDGFGLAALVAAGLALLTAVAAGRLLPRSDRADGVPVTSDAEPATPVDAPATAGPVDAPAAAPRLTAGRTPDAAQLVPASWAASASRVVGREPAGVVAAHVGAAVVAALPQRRVVALAPRQHRVGAGSARCTARDEVGPVAGHDDLVDAVGGEVDRRQQVAERGRVLRRPAGPASRRICLGAVAVARPRR